jgi:hypothetical protein
MAQQTPTMKVISSSPPTPTQLGCLQPTAIGACNCDAACPAQMYWCAQWFGRYAGPSKYSHHAADFVHMIDWSAEHTYRKADLKPLIWRVSPESVEQAAVALGYEVRGGRIRASYRRWTRAESRRRGGP